LATAYAKRKAYGPCHDKATKECREAEKSMTPLQEKLSSLTCVQAGWAFGVPEDGRQQWLDIVEEAVRDAVAEGLIS
jgi:hypothetical protein